MVHLLFEADDDKFSLYVGNTTYEQFWEYVDSIKALGFKTPRYAAEGLEFYTYFKGENATGDCIRIDYYGHNIMCIDFNAAKK